MGNPQLRPNTPGDRLALRDLRADTILSLDRLQDMRSSYLIRSAIDSGFSRYTGYVLRAATI